jgi:hypothetical protein
MADYTKFKRGSEWRRWDVHIHTPETRKNDQFDGANPTEKWERYIQSINSSSEEIAVIGITDYFSVENYFKFKKLIANGKITKQFELVLPNVEIRVVPVTGAATPINLHCIFNPLIDDQIKTRFLSKLRFQYADSDYAATDEELMRLGRKLPGNSGLGDPEAIKAGLEQYVVTMDSLRDIFKNDLELRENTIIVVSNKSNDGASGIRNHTDFFISTGGSQLDATRWSIYQFSDAIFSSNPGDILYFLGLGTDNRDSVIEKCKTLMPCFHGCDAHKNEDIFKPYDNRFCWIKADPTFEGLKQTLYEPEDRVKVQPLKPDIKNDRFIISELQFIDNSNLFGNQKILLNENLNSIIGGKSSGKSLLMYCTAKSIDPDQVSRISKRLGFDGYNLGAEFNFEVTWKNGDKDILNDAFNKNHKITYIPQLYINHLVEKNNKEDLNKLIENILLQDASFKTFHDQKKVEISKISAVLEELITDYFQVRAKGVEIQAKLKESGRSDAIKKGIEGIEKLIFDGQKTSSLNQQEFENYNALVTEKNQLDKLLNQANEKENAIQKIHQELEAAKTSLFGSADEEEVFPIKGKIERILDEMSEIPESIKNLVSNVNTDFSLLIEKFNLSSSQLEIDKEKDSHNKSLLSNAEKLKPYLAKLAGQKELQKLTEQLAKEKQKLLDVINLEKQLISLHEDYSNIRSKTAALMNERYSTYLQIAQKVNDTHSDIGSEIFLHCNLKAYEQSFSLYEQVNKSSIAHDNIFNSLFGSGLVKYEEVIKLFENELKVSDNKLQFKSGEIENTIPLKINISLSDVLRGLLQDIFILDYSVTYKGDDLLSMSPGKKGTVLLILFLQINSSENPILIDQPEDNLDNRTIYELLCKMIKIKKRDRQIIIVSHNANLVVATDSENIIVANQEGQDSTPVTGHFRFQYVNGSIEHSFATNVGITEILYQQGIKEHACDILEGGDDAFKQRERKYSIK